MFSNFKKTPEEFTTVSKLFFLLQCHLLLCGFLGFFFLDTSHEGDHQTQRAPFTTVVVYFCCNCGAPSDSLSLDARSLCVLVPAKLSSSNQNKNEVNIGNISFFVNVVSNFFGSQRYGFILGYSRSSLCRFFSFRTT